MSDPIRSPAEFRSGQIVTVFRSRLRTDNQDAYREHSAQIAALAETMPGLVDVKAFTASDGERVTIVTFADHEAQDGWRRHTDHLDAQRKGRSDYYAEYSIQVAETVRATQFAVADRPADT
ncbi:MAG TPA: antibiotic biosynthesis monooxygenase [Acidimicrobiales bacterium]|jgi:heme-degrading monooxygenase HmoA|nr:antibiotic biosynthesis monooxygenase [Acidimicrobiales bacterium]